jgi:hypothetical protein
MDQHHPELGVDVEPDSDPNIRYLKYNEVWDIEAPPQDMIKCRDYAIRMIKRAIFSKPNFSLCTLN